jgi:hypothetical protein
MAIVGAQSRIAGPTSCDNIQIAATVTTLTIVTCARRAAGSGRTHAAATMTPKYPAASPSE